jgi:Alcohol dehydrogenase GroES-like domain
MLSAMVRTGSVLMPPSLIYSPACSEQIVAGPGANAQRFELPDQDRSESMKVVAAISREGQHAPQLEELELATPRAGIVEAVGEGVTGLRAGDRIVMSGSSCGHCARCRDNFPSCCVESIPRSFSGARLDGSTALSRGNEKIHGHFFGQSSFATHAIADARGAAKTADDQIAAAFEACKAGTAIKPVLMVHQELQCRTA